jgi:curved DNA-binding protein CbpA
MGFYAHNIHMVNNTKINHYAVLGVAVNAEEVVIRAAYRALMQRYHPDKAANSDQAKQNERISAIQQAYQVLSDPVKRAQYDQDLRLAGFGPASGFHDWGVQHGRVDTKLRAIPFGIRGAIMGCPFGALPAIALPLSAPS